MNFRMKAAFAAVFLLTFAGFIHAQDDAIPDPRLARKVTYSATSTPLQEVAAALTKQTGVVIRVGSAERDWKDKERKVHVGFQNLPLGVALAQTAKTLGYELRRSGDEGSWTYRIYQSPRNKDYEAAMLTQQNAEKEKAIADIRQAVLKDADEVAEMTPEEAAQLKDKDPWKAYLGGTPAGRAYAGLLRGLPSEARDLMLRGRQVSLRADELSPAMRESMQQMVDGSFFKKMGPQGGPLTDALNHAQPTRVTFMPLDDQFNIGPMTASSMGISGVAMIMGEVQDANPQMSGMMDQMEAMGMGRGVPMAAMPLAGSGSAGGKMFAGMMDRLDKGESFQTLQQDMMNKIQSGNLDVMDTGVPLTPTPTPTDPVLLAEIQPIHTQTDLFGQSSPTAELIKELEKQTKLSYVVEYYPETNALGGFLPPTKQPLYKLLDSLQRIGMTWEYENGVVRIRPKDWAVQRSYDVPESLMDGYRKILEAKGWLDLEALGGLCASLTDGQIQYRVLKDKDLSALSFGLMSFGHGSRDLLRFYGGLTPDQKAQIKTADGLPFDRLTDSQWQVLSPLVEEESHGTEIQAGKISLAVKETDMPKPPPASQKQPGGKPQPPPPPTPANLPAPNAAKPDSAKPDPTPPGEVQPEGSKPTTAGDEKPGEKPAKAPAPLPTGPMLVQAVFSVEMTGDKPDAPLKFSRRVNVPTKMQIDGMRQGMEAARKQMEDQKKKQDEEKKAAAGSAKTP